MLVKKYDHEFPKKYFDDFLDYCNMNEEDICEILDSWRSNHIWVKRDNKWVLKNPIWL